MSAEQLINPTLSIRFWSTVPPTDDGVLDGISHLTDTDLRGSHDFLTRLSKQTLPPVPKPSSDGRPALAVSSPPYLFKSALDCGAGIGRITRGMLASVAETVDAVEPVGSLAKVMKEDDSFAELRRTGRLGRVWECGLQDWPPAREREGEGGGKASAQSAQQHHRSLWRSEGDLRRGEEKGNANGSEGVTIVTGLEDRKYDLVWIQWCIGYINDAQVLDLFARLTGKSSSSSSSSTEPLLSPTGLIVVKENITVPTPQQVANARLRNPSVGKGNNGGSGSGSGGHGCSPALLNLAEDLYHPEDSSVSRGKAKFERLFEKAGLEVVMEEEQRGFPNGLLPVWIWGLRPKRS